MDIIICVGKVGGCVERECDGRIRSRGVRIQVSGRILDKFKEGKEKSVKAAELRKLEQGGKTIKEFV